MPNALEVFDGTTFYCRGYRSWGRRTVSRTDTGYYGSWREYYEGWSAYSDGSCTMTLRYVSGVFYWDVHFWQQNWDINRFTYESFNWYGTKEGGNTPVDGGTPYPRTSYNGTAVGWAVTASIWDNTSY
jgi:hypothetical protein